MDNLEEIDKFLEKYNFPKLNQEEIDLITSMEIETVIRNLPANKSPGPDGFTAEFYTKFREELLAPTQTLPENCRRRQTSKLILRGHHHHNSKTRQRCHKKRKLQANITDKHRCKNP